jgi:hypothetical protein
MEDLSIGMARAVVYLEGSFELLPRYMDGVPPDTFSGFRWYCMVWYIHKSHCISLVDATGQVPVASCWVSGKAKMMNPTNEASPWMFIAIRRLCFYIGDFDW